MKSLFQSNTKIIPTEFGCLILGLALLLSLIGFLFQYNLTYLVASGIWALFFTDLVLSLFSLNGIRVYRFCPTHASRAKDFSIKLKIENTSFTKFFLKVADAGFTENIPGEILPVIPKLKNGESSVLSYQRQIKARGIYYLNYCSVETSFPLGFWKIKKIYPLQSKIIIYPEFYEANDFVISYRGLRVEFANTSSNRPGLGGDFFEIREFKPGDSLRYLHWRATARTGKLMVKQLEKFTLSNSTIILDNSPGLILGIGEESNFEYAIKTAATIAERALSRRYHIKFICYDDEMNQIQSLKAYGKMTPLLDMLAKVKISEKIDVEDLLQAGIPEIEKESVAIFVLLTLTQGVTKKIMNLSERGVECVLVLFNPKSFAAVIDQKVADFYSIFSQLLSRQAFYLTGRGIRVYMINQGDSIPRALSRPYMFVTA